MSIRSAFLFLLTLPLLGHAAVIVYTGDALPSDAYTEPGNPATNASLFTTIVFPNTSWLAEDGFLKMTTFGGEGIWFGSTGGFGDPSIPSSTRPSGSDDGNSLRITSLLTPLSQSWTFQLEDADGYEANLDFQFTDNGNNQPGVWGRFADGDVRLTDEFFNLNVLHTYEMHIYNGIVAYSIDGSEVARGPARNPGGSGPTYFIGDHTATTRTGSGSMWIDYMEFNNAAGPLAVIPEPSAYAAFAGFAVLCLVVLRRRRRVLASAT